MEVTGNLFKSVSSLSNDVCTRVLVVLYQLARQKQIRFLWHYWFGLLFTHCIPNINLYLDTANIVIYCCAICFHGVYEICLKRCVRKIFGKFLQILCWTLCNAQYLPWKWVKWMAFYTWTIFCIPDLHGRIRSFMQCAREYGINLAIEWVMINQWSTFVESYIDGWR